MLKLEVHTEAVAAEASKDRKLREQSEHYSKQLENELEGLKVAFAFTFVKLGFLPCMLSDVLSGVEQKLALLPSSDPNSRFYQPEADKDFLIVVEGSEDYA